MTDEEFIFAAKRAAGNEYWALFTLAEKDENLMAELRKLLNKIRETHAAGHTLVNPTIAEMCRGGDDPFAPRPAKSEEEEIIGAGELIKYGLLQQAIAVYHRQLSRENAVMILNGYLARYLQPGARWLEQGNVVHAFPGYEVDMFEFARDWSKYHPDEKEIVGPELNDI